MKLMTEMVETNTGRWFPAIRSNETCPMAVTHDAAAAHALMQAMEEEYTSAKVARSKVRQEWIVRYRSMHSVRDRADQIMRSWGFEE